MSTALERLALELDLAAETKEPLRFAFARACVERVRHLIEMPEVAACLDTLGAYVDGTCSRSDLELAAERAAQLANRHPGSRSIDGCGHAAVSATYAVAKALRGQALPAADYAAYAVVYAQGGHGAVSDRESFEPEFSWQVACLSALARGTPPA